ncbi:MAG TPA: site-specific integrase, partial [Mycobacteriales bacterium]|nr:site-specific integrase [Mycobacteriales bacterium]
MGTHPAEAVELSPALADALARYVEHLGLERGLSVHTVRAYRADLEGLCGHAMRLGRTALDEIDLTVLRSWLAKQRSMGASRATLARRSSAARMFTAWAVRDGLADEDAGARLASPRAQRTLPDVLRVDQAAAVMKRAAEDTSVTGLRDAAIVELLYATGARVSELCGVDVDDIDRGRHTVRLFGKGAKERVVPLGVPAAQATERWLASGRPALAVADSPPALLLGARGGRLDPRAARR